MGFMDNFISKKDKELLEDKTRENEGKLDENHNRFVKKKELEDSSVEQVGVKQSEEVVNKLEDKGNLDQSSIDEEHNRLEEVIRKTPIGKYLDDPEVTDISFNGTDGEIRLQDNTGLHTVYDPEVTGEEVKNLGVRVAGEVKKTFDGTDTILDTAVGRFRMNFMHDKISPFGATMAIRVSKPKLAIQDMSKLAPPSIVQVLNLSMKINENVIISGQTGSGKSVANEETIPTPEGNKKMGDLKVGDYVYDRLGKPTEVLGVYPQGKLDVYEVKLIDGRTVRCSEDHIWTTVGGNGNFVNYTVKEMLEKGIRNKNGGFKFRIPNIEPVEKEEKEFKVNPYVMGAFIGDGCLTANVLAFSSEDDWIPTKIAGYIDAVGVVKHKRAYLYYFVLPEDYDYELNKVHRSARYYQTRSLFNDEQRCYSYEKRIPEEYFEGSIEQRYELLQGLMDTDGTIGVYERGDKISSRVSYKTISKGLAEDVQRLASSLGISASINTGSRGDGKLDYHDVNFKLYNEDKYKMFSLPRKVKLANKLRGIKTTNGYEKISIKEITKLGYKEDMTCILVDNEEHLFAAGSYVLVHNTELQKKLVGYIPDDKKITLMEDTPDSHLKVLYPKKDINSWITNKGGDNGKGAVGFTELLKSALRNNPDWAIISETRGEEAKYMVDAAQTDHAIITTLHASGAEMIPNRIISMIAQGSKDFNEVLMGSNITDVLTIGVHMYLDRSNNKMNRFIREVVEFTGYGEDGAKYNFLYRVLNDYDEDTGEYKTTAQVGPVSQRFVDKLKLNRLYHKLPVYHDPRAYEEGKDGKLMFNVKKAEELYLKQMKKEGKEDIEFEVEDNISNIKEVNEKEEQQKKAKAYINNKKNKNKGNYSKK